MHTARLRKRVVGLAAPVVALLMVLAGCTATGAHQHASAGTTPKSQATSAPGSRTSHASAAGRSAAHRSASAATESATQAAPTRPCGTRLHPPRTYQHVVWLVMENHSYDSIIGSRAAPYLNRLAAECGLATNFYAETHPSLPNYIAMTSGSTHGISDDNGPLAHPLSGPSIFSQTGGHWRALQENMPVHCYRGSTIYYAVRHNPATYYTWLHGGGCRTYDLPFNGGPDLSMRFTFITPGICHDMHNCSVSTGDAWLSHYVPTLLARPAYRYGTTVIMITWDEGVGSQQRVPTLVISPYVHPGTRVGVRLNHYSMLRTTENMLGYRYLGHAADRLSAGMRPGFHI